ncbi:MAG: hypothetical protein MUE85_05960 [Microscillaceae bacterium]|jgi:hypothetical protein|nr:hypothetical protein [Microscillaceae bacterium]
MSTIPNFNKITIQGDVATEPQTTQVGKDKAVYFEVHTKFRLSPEGTEVHQRFRAVLLGVWADMALAYRLKIGDTVSVGGFLDVVTFDTGSYSLDVRSDFFTILAYAPFTEEASATMAALSGGGDPPPNPSQPPVVDPPPPII